MCSVPTFSCSLASVYTVSLYSISFSSLSVNLQVNVHTVYWYGSWDCSHWLPRAGVFTDNDQITQTLCYSENGCLELRLMYTGILRYTVVTSGILTEFTGFTLGHMTITYNCHWNSEAQYFTVDTDYFSMSVGTRVGGRYTHLVSS